MKIFGDIFFKLAKWIMNTFYPKYEVLGKENLPNTACMVIGNHSQAHGAIVSEIRFPTECATWCASEMLELREVPAYTFEDFWRRKPKSVKWFYKLLSYIIAPISVCLLGRASTIPVYRDKRILKTFRATLSGLDEGKNIIIFPEHDAPYSHIVCDFQEGFVDFATLYYRRTGKRLIFTPMYLAPKLKQIHFGKPIEFDPENQIENERKRICGYLMQEITAIAEALPEHTVVPYNNVSKKEYKTNKRG